MNRTRILHVVGARPNYPKVAPVIAEMHRYPGEFEQLLVDTGQHYDANLSSVFLRELGMPDPDICLGVGSDTHAVQTAKTMIAFEPVLLERKPDWVFVAGDVNSTLACSLVCAKLGVPCAHVEAGLRSRDRTMPEEINRLLTDQLASLLFTPSRDADENLVAEGIDRKRIRFVGNVMIDTLVRMLPLAREAAYASRFGYQAREYVLVTIHRPSNVDDPEVLVEVLAAIDSLSRKVGVIFPMHPRTLGRISDLGISGLLSNVQVVEPLGYVEFLSLLDAAAAVVTDSGGVQEESTYLGVPCMTLRRNTERPVTVTVGTNRLVESSVAALHQAFDGLDLTADRTVTTIPELWDGRAAERIVDVMLELSA